MPITGRQDPTSHGYDEKAADAIGKKAETILFLSAISILFCCLGGILATYVAYQAKKDADAGNLLAADRGINRAMVYMIISFVVGALPALDA